MSGKIQSMGWLARMDRWNQKQAERDNVRFVAESDRDEDADAGFVEKAAWYGSYSPSFVGFIALLVAGLAGWLRRQRN